MIKTWKKIRYDLLPLSFFSNFYEFQIFHGINHYP